MALSNNQLPEKFRKSLERMAGQAGQSKQYSVPNYDKVLSSYQPKSSGGGGGFGLGTLKNIGSTALKALSVPQAALGTVFTRGYLHKNVPWSAALGDFYRSDEGKTGWQTIAEKGLGLDPKGGFALGLIADPTWFVGTVTKPASIAAKAGKAGKIASEAGEISKAVKVLPKLANLGTTGASATRLARAVRVGEKVKPRIRASVESVRKASRTVEKPVLSPLGPISETTSKVVEDIVNASSKGKHISKGTFGNLLEGVGSFSANTKKFAKAKVGGNKDVFLRIGVGRFSHDIKLGTTKARAFTNAKTAGGLGRSALERASHQIKVSNDEMGQIAIKFLEGVQKNWEKALGLTKDQARLAAERIGSVGIAANQDPIRAAQLKELFTKQGLWSKAYDDLLDQFQSHWDEFASELGMATDKAPGRYFAQSITNETKQALTDDFLERLRGGLVVGNPSITGARLDPTKARKFESSYAALTKDETIDHLVRLGLDEQDARVWAEAWEKFAPEASRFADESTGFRPEFDLFKVAKWREQGQMKVLLDRQIADVAAEAGVLDPKVLANLKSMRPHGPLADSAVGEKLMAYIAVFKTVLTSINPSHYVRNATGDYINHLITGNLRHIQSGAFSSRNLYWRIARGDQDALDAIVKIGGKEYTGAELLVESAMMGLGRGYVGSDIAQMMDIFNKGLHNKPFFKQMVRVNMHRENAVRLETYVKHRRAGEDMFSAAAKTLRVHFDYSDLSDFEKVIMRNMILFYTWLRKNSVLQANGLLLRPGLYSAARTMEDYRPKFEGEPDYISKLAMLGAPGIGYWNVGNPMEALNRFDPTGENFRQTILGAINPAVRVPVELATNRSWRTGYDISRGPSDKQPGLAPSILDALGFNMPKASFTGYTEPAPAMDPNWKYAIENLLLVGPQASTGAALVRPDEPYHPDPGIMGLVERIVGIRKDRPDAAQAARNVLAKIREARREVDIRRKYRIGE